MTCVQIKISEKYVEINGVTIPREVFKLLVKNERLLAINLYRKMKKVHLSTAVDTINPIYDAIVEEVEEVDLPDEPVLPGASVSQF